MSFDISSQRVILGSSANMTDTPSGTVAMVITSPPYWDLKNYGSSNEQIGPGSYEEYLDDLNCVWRECFRVARDGAIMIININSRRVNKKFYSIPFDIVARMEEWEFWDHNIWYIPNALPQPNAYRERLLDNKFESLLIFKKGNLDYHFSKPRVPQKYAHADPRNNKNINGRCLGNIIRIPAYRPPNIKQMGYHVAAYPEELVAFFMQSYTVPGDIVLDPFLGSGTTLKVARVMNRMGIGYEVHADYLPLIERRILEQWEIPDWKALDILHSATSDPNTNNKPRKAHFAKGEAQRKLFIDG